MRAFAGEAALKNGRDDGYLVNAGPQGCGPAWLVYAVDKLLPTCVGQS